MTFYERCVRGALRAYKLTLSPLIGRQCRFAPGYRHGRGIAPQNDAIGADGAHLDAFN